MHFDPFCFWLFWCLIRRYFKAVGCFWLSKNSISFIYTIPNCTEEQQYIRDGPLEKWWGGGGIFSLHEFFFFAHCLCRIFFFRWTPPSFFFQTNIAFCWTVKSWFIMHVFVLYKLFYTHNSSKDTGHFNAKSFKKCTHSERGGSHSEWTASLCIFSVPALLELDYLDN